MLGYVIEFKNILLKEFRAARRHALYVLRASWTEDSNIEFRPTGAQYLSMLQALEDDQYKTLLTFPRLIAMV